MRSVRLKLVIPHVTHEYNEIELIVEVLMERAVYSSSGKSYQVRARSSATGRTNTLLLYICGPVITIGGGVGVAVGVGVGSGVGVAVGVAVAVGMGVGVAIGVAVGVEV